MNIKRMRGRNNRGNNNGGGGNFRNYQSSTPLNRNHVFDSSGPEQRVRGTAQQLYDKYQQMGRDASSSGDRVLAEAYYQHAEHYFRIIAAMNQAQGTHGSNHGNSQGNYQGQHNNGNNRHDSHESHNDQDYRDQPTAQGNGQGGGQGGGQGFGTGDQPTVEPREIPIYVAPPES